MDTDKERTESDDPWDADGGDELEAEIMRANRPFASTLRGTTAEEAVAGQGLEEALARETPEGQTIDEALAIEDDGVPDEEGVVANGVIRILIPATDSRAVWASSSSRGRCPAE